MSDLVEIHDDGSDVEIQDGNPHHTAQHSNSTAFDELKTLKREMEFRGSLLGKTWSELSRIMTRYQAQLIQKHEQVESSASGGDVNRLQKLEKHVSDLEQKLLDKDSEIVRLRTEVHKFRNEVSMKDSLIQKLQNQMAQEAMEFQSELNSMKESFEMSNSVSGAVDVSAKRRRMNAKSQIHSNIQSSSATFPKTEPSLSSCQRAASSSSSAAIFPVPQPMHLSRNQTQTSSSSLDQHAADTGYSDDQSAANMAAIAGSSAHDNDTSAVESGDDNSFYKLEDQDDSNSGDIMTEGEMEFDPNALQADAQMMMQNLQTGSQQQKNVTISTSAENVIVSEIMSSYTGQISAGVRLASEAVADNYAEVRGKFVCLFCRKEFRQKHHVVRHVLGIHYRFKPFKCSICCKEFTRKEHLIQHNNSVHRLGR